MTEHDIVLNLTWIVVLGVGAQWLAWRLHLPSILLLLTCGLIAGPGWRVAFDRELIQPDALLGGLLLPLTSFAVGLILFEGGMTLRVREMRETGGVLTRLVTVGALVTWLLASGAAYALGLVDGSTAFLLGAILVVTGPTVVGPLLHHIRPTGKASALLKWEGIVIDPIGATLALLVFEAILAGTLQEGLVGGALGFLKTAATGGVIGAAGGFALVFPFRRHWIPDRLEAPVAFMVAIAAFTSANMLQEESGLLATTVMGLLAGNLLREEANQILQFKENLQVLLISALFIVLSSRLAPHDLATSLSWKTAVFVILLVVVVRPASVWVSTLGSGLPTNERLLMSWMAPRGIVAAAIASVFGLRLSEHGVAGGEALASITFVVIIATVGLYGLTGAWVARRLGLAEANPQGVVILGADALTKAMARGLSAVGIRYILLDTSRRRVLEARMEGLEALHTNVLSTDGFEELNLAGFGYFAAMTPNDEVNTLAAERFLEAFGRARVYQLPPQGGDLRAAHGSDAHERARLLFTSDAGHERLGARLKAGEVVRATTLTEAFPFERWREHHGERAIPLFLLNEKGQLTIWALDNPPSPQDGDQLVGLVLPNASQRLRRVEG